MGHEVAGGRHIPSTTATDRIRSPSLSRRPMCSSGRRGRRRGSRSADCGRRTRIRSTLRQARRRGRGGSLPACSPACGSPRIEAAISSRISSRDRSSRRLRRSSAFMSLSPNTARRGPRGSGRRTGRRTRRGSRSRPGFGHLDRGPSLRGERRVSRSSSVMQPPTRRAGGAETVIHPHTVPRPPRTLHVRPERVRRFVLIAAIAMSRSVVMSLW